MYELSYCLVLYPFRTLKRNKWDYMGNSFQWLNNLIKNLNAGIIDGRLKFM